MQKQHRDRLDVLRLDLGRDRARVRVIERPFHRTVVEHALLHFEAQRARNQRHVFAKREVERLGPVHAADLVDVPEAFRRDERGLGTLALEDRVDRDGRPVNDELRVARRAAGHPDRIEDTAHEIVRRAERLTERDGSVAGIHHRDVGERPADVDADPKLFTAHEQRCVERKSRSQPCQVASMATSASGAAGATIRKSASAR